MASHYNAAITITWLILIVEIIKNNMLKKTEGSNILKLKKKGTKT